MLHIIAAVIIIIAGLLHCWYSGNANATPGNAARAFYLYGKIVLLITIVLLISGSIIFWRSAGILVAIAAAGVYFFILPLIIMPILEKMGFIPDKECRYTAEEQKRRKINKMGIFTSSKKTILGPKTGPGPESSLKEFPLLYLYFDDFSELQNAARQGAFDLGMQRSYEGVGNYRFEGILADEKRFLDFYRNNMLRLKLHDGTTLYREREEKYWDMVVHPEKYVRKPAEAHPGIHPRAQAELEAELQRLDKEINAEVEAIKRRHGM